MILEGKDITPTKAKITRGKMDTPTEEGREDSLIITCMNILGAWWVVTTPRQSWELGILADLSKKATLTSVFIVTKKDTENQIVHTLLNINKSWMDLGIQSW